MWSPTKSKKYGVAIYNWKATNKYALSLDIGDTVQILEEFPGWYRGFATKNRALKGIFPQTYVHLKPCKVDNEGLFESVVPLEDAVIREVTLVLREWGNIWKKLFVENKRDKFHALFQNMCELLEWRRQLMSGTLTHDQTKELKLLVIAKIDCGNRELGLDLVPRQGPQAVDPDSMSIVDLHQVHVHSAESSVDPIEIKRKQSIKTLTHHLYFCMRDFGYHVGEDCEVYFSLYDSKKLKFISERYLVRISKEGFSNYIDKLHNNCTIFTDLGNADLSRDLYLVAHVLRLGRMMYSESNKRGNFGDKKEPVSHWFRRPHAVGAIHLLDIVSQKESNESDEKEFTFKIYQTEEKDFYTLHEFIIRQNGKYNLLSGQPNYGIVISVKMLHGELVKVKNENPMFFKNTMITRKLGFADVIMPGDVRNDLYLTLDHGEFEKGGKSTGKNIEVTAVVLDSDGNLIENCVWGATGMDGNCRYNSMIIYHHNSPRWCETIRLTIPIEIFSASHVRLEYRHCSTREKTDKKLFGFSFLRLMHQSSGATIHDGQHELYVYKCEDVHKLDSLSYLSQASHSLDKPSQHADGASHNSSFSRSHKETVFVQTLLCSTKLTQNVDLLSLLQYKEHPERIRESLNRILRLGDEELVKFLQDVLDALFSLFSTECGDSTQYSELVFHVLVSIFSLLNETKFHHFKPVMDAYIQGHFAAALVYLGLLSSVQHCAEWAANATDKQELVQKCFISLEYIFKLIIQSRALFALANGEDLEDSFKEHLYEVLKSLNDMLSLQTEVAQPSQIAQIELLKSISHVYQQLTAVLAVTECARLAAITLDSLSRDLTPQLTQAKLIMIRNLVMTRLFQEDESRNVLLATLCRHLRLHLARRDELRLCNETLADIIGFLYKQKRQADALGKVSNCLHHDIDLLSVNILDKLIQTVLIIIDKNTSVLSYLVACLIGLLQLLDEYHYNRLWDDLTNQSKDRKALKDFLLRVFLVFRDLVQREIFPSDWLVIRMAINHVILRSLQELAQPLAFKFLSSREFDSQLWSNYFNLAVAYLTQDSLQLEKFSEVKREKIIEKYGDMRVLMGFQILSMWSQLGDHKLNFIPSMVGPFLEVTLVPERELRKATLHIFFDMMECEQRAFGNFKQVEAELIDKLDILVSENKGDDEYKQLFNTILLDRVQSEDPAWKESGTAFITSVTRLLERLLDYRNVIQGDENRDKRMSCTVNLLKFYKNEINRKEMYLRYIHKLHDLHLSAKNYTEAGCTLKLYADQLDWSGSELVSDPNYAGIAECQLKQILYNRIIDYFDMGKCWEKGIPLIKELASLYECREYNYNKLSEILRWQATFFDNILKKTRLDPEYFRVAFYGLGFPLFVRNKQFIYRGEECEKIGDFTHRLLTEFPNAHILMKIGCPDDTIVNGDAQHLQIYHVKPIADANVIDLNAKIPEKIAHYYYVNDVRQFRFDRVVHKGLIDKENEFKTQWKERTTYVTENSLPGILKWFEVIESTTEEMAPVQVACDNMHTTVNEIKTLLSYCTDKPDFFKQLSMKLKGVVVPEVQGGLRKYYEAFFTAEFLKDYPEHVTFANELYSIIHLELVPLLEVALNKYSKLAPVELLPLHDVMREALVELKQCLSSSPIRRESVSSGGGSRLHRTDSIIHSPLPPLPVEKRPNENARPISGSHYAEVFDEYYYMKMDPTNPSNDISPPPIPQRERVRANKLNLTSNHLNDDGVSTPKGSYDYSSLPGFKSRESNSHNDLNDLNVHSSPTRTLTHHRDRSLTKLPSPKLPLRHSLATPTEQVNVRNSWNDANSNEDAPPLPPRAQDKRGSTTSLEAPSIPRRLPKKASLSVFNAESFDSYVDNAECDNAHAPLQHCHLNNEGFRDSGISTASNSEYAQSSMVYEEFELRNGPRTMRQSASTQSSGEEGTPPPIPPKGHHHSSSLTTGIDLNLMSSLTHERRRSESDNNCVTIAFSSNATNCERPIADNYSIPRAKIEEKLSKIDSAID